MHIHTHIHTHTQFTHIPRPRELGLPNQLMAQQDNIQVSSSLLPCSLLLTGKVVITPGDSLPLCLQSCCFCCLEGFPYTFLCEVRVHSPFKIQCYLVSISYPSFYYPYIPQHNMDLGRHKIKGKKICKSLSRQYTIFTTAHKLILQGYFQLQCDSHVSPGESL